MLRRRSELIGLPVLTKDGAERLGQVADVLVSGVDGRVIGILLAGGGSLLGHRVYPYEEVAAIGNGAVLVNRADAVITTRDGARLRQLLARHSELVGKRLLDEGGDDLGVIDDLIFDTESGRVAGYELSGGVIHDILSGKRFLPATAELRIGDDAVIMAASGTGGEG